MKHDKRIIGDVYCSSPRCPYHDCCERSVMVLEEDAEPKPSANLSGKCKRYAWFVGNKSNGLDVNRDR